MPELKPNGIKRVKMTKLQKLNSRSKEIFKKNLIKKLRMKLTDWLMKEEMDSLHS